AAVARTTVRLLVVAGYDAHADLDEAAQALEPRPQHARDRLHGAAERVQVEEVLAVAGGKDRLGRRSELLHDEPVPERLRRRGADRADDGREAPHVHHVERWLGLRVETGDEGVEVDHEDASSASRSSVPAEARRTRRPT